MSEFERAFVRKVSEALRELADRLDELVKASEVVVSARLGFTKEELDSLPWTPYPSGSGEWILIARAGDTAKRIAENVTLHGRNGSLFAYGYHLSLGGAQGQFLRRRRTAGT